MSLPRAWVAWSSGKDSAWALREVQRAGEVEVVGLLTTVTSEFGRVSMHAVREALLDQQAERLGLPCRKVRIPWPCPNEAYEREMERALAEASAAGVSRVVFGDLFLPDVRAYREAKLAGTGIEPLFPLWGRDTARLARDMLDGGLEATLTCVDPRRLGREHAGRAFDAALLDALPAGVDPCGENGEFHTFVSAGPMFREPVRVVAGEVVEREGFVFADLKPAEVVAG
ncbi:adenine nucleotide alpha hydrolase [Anaeromyxobacter diazotrophicus]|uniref:ATPase n=1 Tax=Anaeromyxobacter diazotrophicus TaxID=2590199 RepID=A0A7I9VT59_9BACT|nr:adenine nucleotide alpha hydrolase [Anaeromyxobacter diazotrophicus]GEJ59127.1 ATPase [Anaeromyxobacter diazotrophicus]